MSAPSDRDFRTSNIGPDLEPRVLRPTPAELETRVLYSTWRDHPILPLEDDHKIASLQKLGLSLTVVREPEQAIAAKDYGFIFIGVIEGSFAGRETLMPGLAAMRGVPCLGASGTVRAVSEDKVIGKGLAQLLGLEVAKHTIVSRRIPGISSQPMPGRWIMKPRYGTLSEALTYGDGPAAWRKAVQRSIHPMHGGEDFIAEEFVPGLNLAVPLVEGLPTDSLPVFVEKADNEFNILTNSGKMGLTPDYKSEPYDGPGASEARAAAAKFADAISPYDYARVDFRYEPVSGRLVFLEVNMSCAIGPYSVVARGAALRGVDHVALMGHLFAHSLRRQRNAA